MTSTMNASSATIPAASDGGIISWIPNQDPRPLNGEESANWPRRQRRSSKHWVDQDGSYIGRVKGSIGEHLTSDGLWMMKAALSFGVDTP
jgi:hypothetical protein